LFTLTLIGTALVCIKTGFKRKERRKKKKKKRKKKKKKRKKKKEKERKTRSNRALFPPRSCI
jgi:flagellar biosynthesis component FlhA